MAKPESHGSSGGKVSERRMAFMKAISMNFSHNTSPLAGKDGGRFLTSRHIRERLELAFGSTASLITHQNDEQFFAVLSLPYVENTDN